MDLDHPVFEIVTTTAGAVSIRNKVVNEIMHNPVGPWAEANALYIEQSDLRTKLSSPALDEFVLFDIGLGAAANALAVLHCARSIGPQMRPLRLISFERDLELLHFALAHADQFDHFDGFVPAINQLLAQGTWSNGPIHWELRHGDFLQLIQAEKNQPHLIFFDPYSPKVNQEMWTISNFEKIRRVSRSPEDGGTTLYTYSQATKIRASLLRAGFFVGYGRSTGLKSETTVAATDYSALESPLAESWFARWQKSGDRRPFAVETDELPQIESYIAEYFKKLK